jgi:transposase
MPASPLLAHLSACHIESVTREDSHLSILATARYRTSRCPLCSRRSNRIHSRYQRTIRDLPCFGTPVVLHLRLRRFVCRNHRCRRHIFCERLPDLVDPRVHRTNQLRHTLQTVGLALGGEAGSRLAGLLGMPTSSAGMLRLVRLAPLPTIGTIQVLGVDDWCKRKGRTYGTLLVDLEQYCPIDLIDDRTSEVFASWLRDHPGIEIISRDRAKDYAEGGREGAPNAVQVADRWHLTKNLGDVLERALAHRHGALRAAGEQATPVHTEAATVAAPPAELPAAEHDRAARRARRLERYEQVRALQVKGLSVSAIARATGFDWRTVRKFVGADAFPERLPRRPGPASLHAYEDYLREKWNAGCQNAEQIWREIVMLGYPGSAQTVRRFVATWPRAIDSLPVSTSHRKRACAPRQAAWLLTQLPETLKEDERTYLQGLRETDPTIDRLYRLAQEFRRIVRERDCGALTAWLTGAADSGIRELRGFATHLRTDLAAIEAALSLPWSNGQTEGQITRLKLIKREMYGRANLDLLRLRVLYRS